MRSRTALSAGVIVALVVAVWAAFASGDDEPPPSTTTSTSTSAPPTSTTVTSTSTTSVPTTSTTAASTSTTTDEEGRVEEVRLILQDLWFRWLHGLYSANETTIHDVVATEDLLADFESAQGTIEFAKEPEPDDLEVVVEEILRDSEECLVVHRTIDADALLAGQGVSTGVDVLWPHDGDWRLASGWSSPSDLWQDDCESVREELP